MRIEAYDLGGTWLRSAIIEDGRIISKRKENTEKDFCAQIKRISGSFNKYESQKISLAVPGPVQENILLSAPPLGKKKPVDFRSELSSLEKEIIVENDLNAAVLAELYEGQGKQWKNFYLLTISTGIGAGIVMDGHMLKGGEFGHCQINTKYTYSDRICFCGRVNCWCAYSSGKGLERAIKEDLGYNYPIEKIFKEERRLPKMNPIIFDMKNANTLGLALMINALDVEGIVVMGSLGLKQFKHIMPTKRYLERFAFNPVPPIVKTKLGDDIGLLGAYYRAVS